SGTLRRFGLQFSQPIIQTKLIGLNRKHLATQNVDFPTQVRQSFLYFEHLIKRALPNRFRFELPLFRLKLQCLQSCMYSIEAPIGHSTPSVNRIEASEDPLLKRPSVYSVTSVFFGHRAYYLI